MIRRNEERRKLLNESTAQIYDIDDECDDNESQHSGHTSDHCVKPLPEFDLQSRNILRTNSHFNVQTSPEEIEEEAPIRPKQSEENAHDESDEDEEEDEEEAMVDPQTKQVIENLAKMESERRVPLSRRLNLIARNLEDSENIDFIDSDDSEAKVTRVRSPTKTMRQPVSGQNDSPPKKRLQLNERLNQLARTFDDSEETEIKGPKKQLEKSDLVSPKKRMNNSMPKSPMKLIYEPEKKPVDVIPKSPVRPKVVSPKKSTDDAPKSSALSIIELQKKFLTNEVKSSDRSPMVIEKKSTNDKRKSPVRTVEAVKPISLNMGSVGRQTHELKRTSIESPVVQPVVKTPKIVSNKISKMRELFEEKFSPYVTNTATLYQQEVERRKQEVEMLKREEPSLPQQSPTCSPAKKSLLSNEYSVETNINNEVVGPSGQMDSHEEQQESFDDNNDNNNDDNNEPVSPRESIDNETAQQTVCDAFREIEDYSSEHEEELNDNLNCSIDSRISQSKLIIDKKMNISPTKNRLYPDLNLHDNEEIDPPSKPPRLFLASEQSQPIATNTTPMRTISFYRKEKSAQNSKNNTPSVVLTVPKKTVDNSELDIERRNRKINDKILELQRGIDDAARIAGQASQALNVCLETDEFRGSTERVEAEKLLLFSGKIEIIIRDSKFD